MDGHVRFRPQFNPESLFKESAEASINLRSRLRPNSKIAANLHALFLHVFNLCRSGTNRRTESVSADMRSAFWAFQLSYDGE